MTKSQWFCLIVFAGSVVFYISPRTEHGHDQIAMVFPDCVCWECGVLYFSHDLIVFAGSVVFYISPRIEHGHDQITMVFA